MKRLFFLLIILIKINNISYASFPVTIDTKIEVVEDSNVNNSIDDYKYILLGFFVGFFSWFLLLLPLLLLFVPNKGFRQGIIAGFLSMFILLGLMFSGEIFS
tara:strand:+ start:168 stop:473 length:306 start_codon:yes stop_codon:yes gene_type:complete